MHGSQLFGHCALITVSAVVDRRKRIVVWCGRRILLFVGGVMIWWEGSIEEERGYQTFIRFLQCRQSFLWQFLPLLSLKLTSKGLFVSILQMMQTPSLSKRLYKSYWQLSHRWLWSWIVKLCNFVQWINWQGYRVEVDSSWRKNGTLLFVQPVYATTYIYTRSISPFTYLMAGTFWREGLQIRQLKELSKYELVKVDCMCH